MSKNKDHLVWIDMEMTGLDPDQDQIIEIATIITDKNLDIVAEGPELIIHQEPSRFDTMDKWNREHHSKSGLWEKVLKSTITLEQAEAQTLNFIKRHTDSGCFLAGNSIWQDRRFLRRYMPNIDKYLHYRILDVSTLKILSQNWYPKVFFAKKNAHRALEDIKESINELKFYREQMFRN